MFYRSIFYKIVKLVVLIGKNYLKRNQFLPYTPVPSKKVTQHDFNRLYQFVYGFVLIMLGIIWKLGYFVFPSILHLIMIALQKRAQGGYIGFGNVKK